MIDFFVYVIRYFTHITPVQLSKRDMKKGWTTIIVTMQDGIISDVAKFDPKKEDIWIQ